MGPSPGPDPPPSFYLFARNYACIFDKPEKSAALEAGKAAEPALLKARAPRDTCIGPPVDGRQFSGYSQCISNNAGDT